MNSDSNKSSEFIQNFIQTKVDNIILNGELYRPTNKNAGICIFVHGSGSNRFSPRYVAKVLRSYGIGTYLLDLLTLEEERIDELTRHLRFDIDMLSKRVVSVIDQIHKDETLKGSPIGLFGASTGGGAALLAAYERPNHVKLVVSRGGRPDLVNDEILKKIKIPTLFIVGGKDPTVLNLNQIAYNNLGSEIKRLEVIPDATHLFEEPGCLEKVADLAAQWMKQYLKCKTEE
ncbi:1736_t:CDS:2 [Diversispora eburnea]|uniref:1736_t:CDS:1 n=1 Tax=Diversispora eburnea TaxID=1213867 RepID=A0A9N9CDA1_9GLOM|nr:1736_t:CDS:2 [Diversispora eburnea]